MTAADPGAIADVCGALGLVPTPAQLSALHGFQAMLLRWGAVYNLSGIRDAAGVLTIHLADSLAIVPAVARAAPKRLLDVGSGGGLPAIPLAVMLPQVRVTCVEAVGKKAAFLRQAAVSLKLRNLVIEHERVERLPAATRHDLITARAFASLGVFTAMTERLLAEGGFWLAMKGRTPHEEIAALTPSVEVFHVEPLSVPGSAAARVIVWLRRVAPAAG